MSPQNVLKSIIAKPIMMWKKVIKLKVENVDKCWIVTCSFRDGVLCGGKYFVTNTFIRDQRGFKTMLSVPIVSLKSPH